VSRDSSVRKGERPGAQSPDVNLDGFH
jgi:hypothetical protein